MGKRLHIISNAHIDPVWQWEWEEGAAETLSTFRIAADFCDQYDGYVFCHNEALLYKWVEEYDKHLFERIQQLVREDKWHIMGGWHLQPDCLMPNGEFFVRQIMSGRQYFLEKFGKVPTVAINFDPFGHSRGLVQILKKTGYDAYLFMRPDESVEWFDLPANDFKWVGFDGSEVTGIRMPGVYSSRRGQAAQKVADHMARCKEDDFFLCLWGVGNHGGGPSKKDLDDITAFAKEQKALGNEVIHSTPEKYYADIVEYGRDLPEYKDSITPWGVGCYTSQVRIKQKYRLAENTFTLAETICSQAYANRLMEYPENAFAEALYDILTVQFHDALPGTSIQPVEEMAIRMLDHAIEILNRVKAKAFFALASGQKKADSDKIPVFAYNPYPYEVSGDLTCEFMLWDQIRDERFLQPTLITPDGKEIAAQCETEHSTIPIEWRKRIVFNTTLAPLSLNRFDCAFETLKRKPDPVCEESDTHFIFDNGSLRVEISKISGLVDSYMIDGKEYVKKNAFLPQVFKDDFDPWGMLVTGYREKIGEFRIATPDEAARFCCLDSIQPVHLIEGGAVRTVVEAILCYNDSRALIKYYMSQKDGFKIDIRIVWNEKQKMVKLCIPTAFGAHTCIGEHPFGNELMKNGMDENVSQRFIYAIGDSDALAIGNNGVYGSSFDEKEGVLYITLLRSPSYTAHPVDDRQVMPPDRYQPYIEQGERDYSFVISAGDKNDVTKSFPRRAHQFNLQPMLLSFYPTGTGEPPQSPWRLESDAVVYTAFKKAEKRDGFVIRLHNPTDSDQKAKVIFNDMEKELTFGKFEVKTLLVTNSIEETDLLEGMI